VLLRLTALVAILAVILTTVIVPPARISIYMSRPEHGSSGMAHRNYTDDTAFEASYAVNDGRVLRAGVDMTLESTSIRPLSGIVAKIAKPADPLNTTPTLDTLVSLRI
jgi:hypothetical protein